jgi:23S rRNA pseudouridine2605 synthase
MATDRLQKILAHAGVASRRAAERFITEGHVRVNGRVVKELGAKADPHKDRVELDGKRLVAEHPVYYLLHKPREVITTLSDPEQRESVADLTKRIPERVFPVGRLDYHTSGALLMTNDGEMAQALLHPKKRVPKVYIAKVRGVVADAHLQQLRLGVTLDDGQKTGPAEVFIANEERGNMWLQITITEGKNRQIHRMLDAVGYRVTRLFRLSFAGLSADGLRTGEFRTLTDSELSKLKRDYLNPSKKDKADTKRDQRRARMAGELGLPAPPPGWEPAHSLPRPLRDREEEKAPAQEGVAGARGPRAGAARGGGERGAGAARGQVQRGTGAVRGQVQRDAGAARGHVEHGAGAARGQIQRGAGAARGHVQRGAAAAPDGRTQRTGKAFAGKSDKRDAKRDPRRTRAAVEHAGSAPAPRWEPARSLPRALRDRDDAKGPARQGFAAARDPRAGAARGQVQRGASTAVVADGRTQRTGKAFRGKSNQRDAKRDPRHARAAGEFGRQALAPRWEPARSLPRSLRDREEAKEPARQGFAGARDPRAGAARGQVQRGAGGAAVDPRAQRTAKVIGGQRRNATGPIDAVVDPRQAKFGAGKKPIGFGFANKARTEAFGGGARGPVIDPRQAKFGAGKKPIGTGFANKARTEGFGGGAKSPRTGRTEPVAHRRGGGAVKGRKGPQKGRRG